MNQTATVTIHVRTRFLRPGMWLCRAGEFVWPSLGLELLAWWLNHVVRIEYREGRRWRRADRVARWDVV